MILVLHPGHTIIKHNPPTAWLDFQLVNRIYFEHIKGPKQEKPQIITGHIKGKPHKAIITPTTSSMHAIGGFFLIQLLFKQAGGHNSQKQQNQ